MKCYTWPSRARQKSLLVALPSSILYTDQTLELKTIKASFLARILSIFRVTRAILYPGLEDKGRDLRVLRKLLEYSLTPPHLKRKLHPLTRTLKYAGLMQPLRLPNHELPLRPVKGVVIDGYVEACTEHICRVFLGELGYGVIENRGYKPGDVVTVSLRGFKGEEVLLEQASWGSIYTGFDITVVNNIGAYLKKLKGRGYVIIGATKEGECSHETFKKAISRALSRKGLVLIIGSPYHDILDYAPRSVLDYEVNTVPFQGTISVRSEEALLATLALINFYIREPG